MEPSCLTRINGIDIPKWSVLNIGINVNAEFFNFISIKTVQKFTFKPPPLGPLLVGILIAVLFKFNTYFWKDQEYSYLAFPRKIPSDEELS